MKLDKKMMQEVIKWVGETYDRDVRFPDRWYERNSLLPKVFFTSDQLAEKYLKSKNK